MLTVVDFACVRYEVISKHQSTCLPCASGQIQNDVQYKHIDCFVHVEMTALQCCGRSDLFVGKAHHPAENP